MITQLLLRLFLRKAVTNKSSIDNPSIPNELSHEPSNIWSVLNRSVLGSSTPSLTDIVGKLSILTDPERVIGVVLTSFSHKLVQGWLK